MAFKAVFLAHAPDAEPEKMIVEAVGRNVGVFVARGDDPSNRVSTE